MRREKFDDPVVLVHGTVEAGGGRMAHAWVELPLTDGVWDPALGYMRGEQYRRLLRPEVGGRWDETEAQVKAVRMGHFGPWV